jgi:hypothetical protein
MKMIIALTLAAGTSFGLAQNAVAEEFEWPSRKAGQWELHMKSSADAPEMTMQLCLDASTDKGMMQMGMGLAKSMCPDQKIAREGGKIIIDGSCSIAGMTVKGRTEVSGDFQSEYTMTSTSEMPDAPEGMPKTTEMEHKARWVGETCKNGMQPGDIEMPGGIKMNMKSMMGMMESLGGGAAAPTAP